MKGTLLFIGGLGAPELVLLFGILILLFGANRLPGLARSMGEATKEFDKGRKEIEEEIENEKNKQNENQG
jgi:sec-independent protein translocase protein TatA